MWIQPDVLESAPDGAVRVADTQISVGECLVLESRCKLVLERQPGVGIDERMRLATTRRNEVLRDASRERAVRNRASQACIEIVPSSDRLVRRQDTRRQVVGYACK